MSGIGNYRNLEIQNILDSLVTEEKYGEYKPIIDEIIQRRAFQYGFSIDRMKAEIENLVRNLEGFELADEKKIEEIGYGTLAAYSRKDKKIYINAEEFKTNREFYQKNLEPIDARWVLGKELFHLITHEIYHAISQHSNNTSGIEQKDEFIENAVTGIGLNEIITESATARTVLYMTNEEKNNGGYMPTQGYQTLTSTSSVLASAIGTSENELLAHGLNDPKEFEEFVYNKMPETMDSKKKESLLNGLRFKTDMLNSSAFFARADLIPNLYGQYYTSLIKMATTCMKEEQKQPSKENVGAMYYRIAKIGAVLTVSIESFAKSGIISEEEKNTMLQNPELLQSFQDLKDVVLDTYKSCKGNNFEGKTSAEVEQSLLYDMMKEPEYGTKRNRLFFEDTVQRGNWDNSVFQYSCNVINNELERFEKSKNNSQVLKADEQTMQQVINNVNTSNSLIEKPKNYTEDDRDDR